VLSLSRPTPAASSAESAIVCGIRAAPRRARFPQRVRVRPEAEREAIAEARAMRLHEVTLVGRDGKPLINPAVIEHERERRQSVENRIADRITAFSGSMRFVYLHVVWFGLWIGLGVEGYPYGLLTMIVSLEAIFLSTFVMISQNRADAKREVLATQQWQTVQDEDAQNVELLRISNQILELTKAVHEATALHRNGATVTSLDAAPSGDSASS
jgi:uncharacterized membrane protein